MELDSQAVQGPLSCGHLCSDGSQGLRQVCLNELWGTSHPISPPILAKPWSSVDLSFTSFCAFYEEIELGKPDWEETYQKAGKVSLIGEEVLRSCI